MVPTYPTTFTYTQISLLLFANFARWSKYHHQATMISYCGFYVGVRIVDKVPATVIFCTQYSSSCSPRFTPPPLRLLLLLYVPIVVLLLFYFGAFSWIFVLRKMFHVQVRRPRLTKHPQQSRNVRNGAKTVKPAAVLPRCRRPSP